MHLVDVRAVGFRNLDSERVEWNRHGNLLFGGNGEGKTNFLEAVTVLGNLRSFRTPSMRQVVTHGEPVFFLEGRVRTATGEIRLGQEVTPGPPLQRNLLIGGAPAPVSRYLQVFPVVAISGADRELVTGGPSGRRTFLDRFTFLLNENYFDEIRQFSRVLKQRNAALINSIRDGEMVVWEARLAAAAAVVVDRRRRMCHKLAEAFRPIYDELRGDAFPDVDLRYRGGAGFEPAEKVLEVEEYYRKRYNETRTRDRRTGFTAEGPHRHDLRLLADGKPVRHTLSSGQTKVVAAALRLASLKQIERERGEHLPVIIDDVDAELDAAVLSRLIDHLEGPRQLFLSSADAGVFTMLGTGSSRLEIRQGTVIETVGEQVDE